MLMIRKLSHDPAAQTYDVVIRCEHGDYYDQMTEAGLSEWISESPDPDRVRSLRRLTHLNPYRWVPAVAADGRMAA